MHMLPCQVPRIPQICCCDIAKDVSLMALSCGMHLVWLTVYLDWMPRDKDVLCNVTCTCKDDVDKVTWLMSLLT